MKLTITSGAAVLALAGLPLTAFAQPAITRSVVAGGGGATQLGPYAFNATFGQAFATARVTLGPNTFTAGYWGEGSPCPVCSADYNNDGGVDGDDVIAFFADWDNSTGCADANRDQGIDGDDAIFFFERWDAGGC